MFPCSRLLNYTPLFFTFYLQGGSTPKTPG